MSFGVSSRESKQLFDELSEIFSEENNQMMVRELLMKVTIVTTVYPTEIFFCPSQQETFCHFNMDITMETCIDRNNFNILVDNV